MTSPSETPLDLASVLSLDMHHGRETIVMLYDGRISPWPLDTPVEFLDDEPANGPWIDPQGGLR